MAVNDKYKILIVDDNPANIDVLLNMLNDEGFHVFISKDGESAIQRIKKNRPDLILMDIMMPGMDGYETTHRIRNIPDFKSIPIIFITALNSIEDKLKGFEVGGVDYIVKPFNHAEVLARLRIHLELKELRENLEKKVAERTEELQLALAENERLKNKLEAEKNYLQEEIIHEKNIEGIICKDERFKMVLKQVARVAESNATVLILGETGTGKELVARMIHQMSPRNNHPLIKVNCAALPANLIESELFGHEKGAFTGAISRKTGRFELADKGTIFLDEIGELPLELQAKLLRVLQESEFERLGGHTSIRVDVRILAATNRNLEQQIQEGLFREDLYYRLNVFPVSIPPLRERKEDIPVLVDFFLKKYCRKNGKKVKKPSANQMSFLTMYDWPGNVRELENIIERAVILSDREVDFEPLLTPLLNRNVKPSLAQRERQYLLELLESSQWKIEGEGGAARKAGVAASTFRDRMKKAGINRPKLS